MQVSVSGHHFDISDRIRTYVEEEAGKLERFYSPLIDCHVTITEEGRMKRADVMVNVHAQSLKASCEVDSVYVAIDGAMEKTKHQLKRLHGKRHSRRGHGETTPEEGVEDEG